MASEESMEIPMIIDDVEPQSGEVQSAVAEIKDPPKNRKKILPRYLSASLGSCHDFCKFGIKHDTEAEERIPLRVFLKARRNEQRLVRANSETKNVNDPDTRKKEAVLKKKTVSLKEDLPAVEGSVQAKKSPLRKWKSFEPRTVKKLEETLNISRTNQNKEGSNSRRTSLSAIEDAEPQNSNDEDVLEKTVYVIESTIESTNSKATHDNGRTTAKPTQPSRKIWRPKVKSSPSLSAEKNRRSKIEARSKVSPLYTSKENGLSSLDNQAKATKQRRPKKIVTPKVEGKTGTKFEWKNRGTLVPETKSDPARKLKFRRGTILDLKSENTVAPRRLIFRRAKSLGESQTGKDENQRSVNTKVVPVDDHDVFGAKTIPEKLVSRNYQNTRRVTPRKTPRRNPTGSGEDGLVGPKMSSEKVGLRNRSAEADSPRLKVYKRREIAEGDMNSETSTEKVVLRHQNLAGKTKVRSLFNNVIKETASKLVEARKSKVKALVGAFETVISLQDGKGKTTVHD